MLSASRPASSAPVVVGRGDGGELHRNDVTRRDQAIRVMRVFRPAALQHFDLLLHRMDGVAGEHDGQSPSLFRRLGDQRVVGNQRFRRPSRILVFCCATLSAAFAGLPSATAGSFCLSLCHCMTERKPYLERFKRRQTKSEIRGCNACELASSSRSFFGLRG